MLKIYAIFVFVSGPAIVRGAVASPSDYLLSSWLPDISYPGTNWCGPGNTAKNFDDLGYYRDVDRCCRAHDHCDYIASGASKNGLTNSGSYTILHCDCEIEFKRCLKAINSMVSWKIGSTYFDVQEKCYQIARPIRFCAQSEIRNSLLRIGGITRCISYRLEDGSASTFQWFDLPVYSSSYGYNNIGGL